MSSCCFCELGENGNEIAESSVSAVAVPRTNSNPVVALKTEVLWHVVDDNRVREISPDLA